MKITWIVLDDITGIHNNSTHTRASLVAPHMPDTVICSTVEYVKQCDVIIYQDRFEQHDVYLAEELIRDGRTLLIDISFPIWNPYFTLYNAEKRGYFKRLAKLSSGIIVPIDSYKIDIKQYFPDKLIKVIPNRVNLDLYLKGTGLNRLEGLKELDVRYSAKEYTTLISTLTKDKPIKVVKSKIESKIFSSSKVPELNSDLILGSHKRLEELNKKSKMLLLVEVSK